jgi:hypothetical protein
MQNEIVDKKVSILFNNYKEKAYAREAQLDIESFRNKASNLGLAVTTGAFVLNEVVRMSMRSRKYLLLMY